MTIDQQASLVVFAAFLILVGVAGFVVTCALVVLKGWFD